MINNIAIIRDSQTAIQARLDIMEQQIARAGRSSGPSSSSSLSESEESKILQQLFPLSTAEGLQGADELLRQPKMMEAFVSI